MNYAAIRNYDIANGEGIRVTLFVSGCDFHCKDCFNPEVQSYTYGQPFTDQTADKLIDLIQNPVIAGLSLLGGDPLCQKTHGLEQLISLCDRVHGLNKNVWIWSGFTIEQIFAHGSQSQKNLILSSDVFVDGPFDIRLANRALKWRGSANQRVINIPKTIESKSIVRAFQ